MDLIQTATEIVITLDTSIFGSKSNTDIIITRATEEKLLELKTLTPESLTKIAEFMPEVNRATNAFGKTQSQYMNNAMTISSFAPYRNLRQILAEIENRRQALKENVFKIKKNLIQLERKKAELKVLIDIDDYEKNKFDITLLEVEIQEIESGVADSRMYIEGALKTILSYQEAYKDICKSHNIPDKWDEKDFEEDEERHHITKAFQQAHADILAGGRIGQGNHEYFWQCGINPQLAYDDLVKFINSEQKDIDTFIKFLTDMYDKYKGSLKKILSFKGINPNGYYDEAVYHDLNKKMDI